MQLPPSEERFKLNLQDLVTYFETLLNEVLARSKIPIDMKSFTKGAEAVNKYNAHQLIVDCARGSYPYWEQLLPTKPNREFFLKNIDKMFSGETVNAIRPFKVLFEKKCFHAEQEQDIWTTVRTLVKICIRYLHEQTQAGNPAVTYIPGDFVRPGQQMDYISWAPKFGLDLTK